MGAEVVKFPCFTPLERMSPLTNLACCFLIHEGSEYAVLLSGHAEERTLGAGSLSYFQVADTIVMPKVGVMGAVKGSLSGRDACFEYYRLHN